MDDRSDRWETGYLPSPVQCSETKPSMIPTVKPWRPVPRKLRLSILPWMQSRIGDETETSRAKENSNSDPLARAFWRSRIRPYKVSMKSECSGPRRLYQPTPKIASMEEQTKNILKFIGFYLHKW